MTSPIERPRPTSFRFILGLVVALHADWHLARSPHHRLSLNWHQHWIFCVLLFGAAAWWVQRRWPSQLFKASLWNLGLALLGAQLVEPIFESAYYLHQVGYNVERDRWIVLAQCVLPGLVIYIGVLWILARTNKDAGSS